VATCCCCCCCCPLRCRPFSWSASATSSSEVWLLLTSQSASSALPPELGSGSSVPQYQGITLVNCLAQLKRLLLDRGCI